MLTNDQIAANRKSASNLVKYQLGLDQKAVTDWTYEERTQYDKALAVYILGHPDAFGAQEIQTAQDVKNTDYTALDDASFSFEDFATDSFAPLANAAQSVGDGVLTVANAAKWAIPTAVVIAAIIGIYMLNAKAGKPIKLPGAS